MKKTIEKWCKVVSLGNAKFDTVRTHEEIPPKDTICELVWREDAPEVEIQPGQRWTKYGTTWTVQQNGEWWQIVTESHQVTLIGDSDSFDSVAYYERKELQRWLNENATIEEDGK